LLRARRRTRQGGGADDRGRLEEILLQEMVEQVLERDGMPWLYSPLTITKASAALQIRPASEDVEGAQPL